MTKVEPLNIATNRERLTAALALANLLMSKQRQANENPEAPIEVEGDVGGKITSELHEYAEEMKAIYYTLRLNGADESEFPEKILAVTVDEICISVEQISDTEVRCYYLPPESAEAAETAV